MKSSRKIFRIDNFFYASFTYSNGVLTSEVKKHPIQLTIKEFTWVCNLPCTNQEYDENDEEGNEFNFDLIAQSFLIDQYFSITNPFTIGFIRP